MEYSLRGILMAGLLSLTLVHPSHAAITVAFDLKPGSCPNPINPPGLEVLPHFPTAIAGTDTLDVSTIDAGSLLLVVPEGGGLAALVPPISTHIDDVATPFFPEERCDCIAAGEDGTDDLSIHFDMDAVEAALGPRDPGEEIGLCIIGTLLDGTPFLGCDCVIVVGPSSVDKQTWGTIKHLYR